MSIQRPSPTPSDREIREVSGEERLTGSVPLTHYAFRETPPAQEELERVRKRLPYWDDEVALLAMVDGQAKANVVGMRMRQNVRGRVLPMLGVSAVATDPTARRGGHVRALLAELHTRMRDEGRPIAVLYPFRASFYERFGYVGLPLNRSIRLFPDGLSSLHRLDLPGKVELQRIGAAYVDYDAFVQRFLAHRHGFALNSPVARTALRDDDDQWVALARRDDDQVIGALLYRTRGHGGELSASAFFTIEPLGRALLLQWIARHDDQFGSFVLPIDSAERPELWFTEVQYAEESQVRRPTSMAPMARVLDVPGLAGLPVGPARAVVRVVDDPFIAGVWTLEGTDGALRVHAGGEPTATLTCQGLSGLVYGVLDPSELGVRGFGSCDSSTADALSTLFPRATPYLYAAI